MGTTFPTERISFLLKCFGQDNNRSPALYDYDTILGTEYYCIDEGLRKVFKMFNFIFTTTACGEWAGGDCSEVHFQFFLVNIFDKKKKH